MDVITHLFPKALQLFSSALEIYHLHFYIFHRVLPHTDPNTGRKMMKKYPELARFQISHQLTVNAAGVALIALTQCWQLVCPLWIFADSETVLATLLTWSFTLTQGILVTIFILGLVGLFGFFPVRRMPRMCP